MIEQKYLLNRTNDQQRQHIVDRGLCGGCAQDYHQWQQHPNLRPDQRQRPFIQEPRRVPGGKPFQRMFQNVFTIHDLFRYLKGVIV